VTTAAATTTTTTGVQSGLTYQETDASTGRRILRNDLSEHVSDMNHLQLIEEDEYAIISSRMTNSIIKVKAHTADVSWTLGGSDGDFAIVTPDGETHAAGYSYWKGQHNVNYIGEDEYSMFDNNYGHASEGSRMLIVDVDVESLVATVVWEYHAGTLPKAIPSAHLTVTRNW
jgi:hypothetical protein